MAHSALFLPLLASLALATASGCKQNSTAASTPSVGGSGGTFTASDLVKSWSNLSCNVGAAEPLTGATRFIQYVTFGSGGTFNAQSVYYSTPGCTGGTFVIGYTSIGTYTVGGLIPGSSSLQSIQFTVTSSQITAYTTAAQTAVNNDCGGTSPYAGGVNSGANGVGKNSYLMSCMSMNFPNSGNRIADNVVGLSGGVLSLGAFYPSIPGVFAGSTVPTVASLTLN